MNEFVRPISLYKKILSRNPFILLMLAISIFYVCIVFYSYILDDRYFHPGSALTLSSFFIQCGIFTFSLLGIYLDRNHKKYEFILYRNTVYLYLGKISFISLVIITFCSFLAILFFILVRIKGLTVSPFYIDSFMYILVYWVVVFLIAFLIGIILSMLIPSLIVYFISIFICFFIGPVNYRLLDNRIAERLNLGQRENDQFYHPLYGYLIEDAEIFKRLFILCFLIVIFLLIQLYHHKKMYKAIVIPLVFSLGFTVVTSHQFLINNQHEQKINLGLDPNGEVIKEYRFYESHVNANIKKLNNQKEYFTPLNYKIRFNTDKGFLQSKVSIKFKIEKVKEELKINLYHGFKINTITLNNTEVNFTRKGDIIIIPIDKHKDINELMIDYEGKSSPLFYANSRAIFLPGNFAWIPSFNLTPSLQIYEGHFHRNYSQNTGNVEYEVEYLGSMKIFTNLDKKDSNTYRKSTTEGVSIISGDIMEVNLSSSTIYIARTWERGLKEYSSFSKFLDKVVQEVNMTLNKKIEIPKKIFIIPTTGIYDEAFTEDIWTFSDHWLIGYPLYTSFHDKSLLNKEHLINSLVPALTWKNDGIYRENLFMVTLFDACFSNWLGHQIGFHNDDYLNFTLDSLSSYYKNRKEVTQVLYKLKALKKEEFKQIDRIFFANWYDMLKTKQNDWIGLEELIDKYNNNHKERGE
jgi:hypothetical protein